MGNSNSQPSTARPAENVLPISSAPVKVLLSDMFKTVALHSHKSNVKRETPTKCPQNKIYLYIHIDIIN